LLVATKIDRSPASDQNTTQLGVVAPFSETKSEYFLRRKIVDSIFSFSELYFFFLNKNLCSRTFFRFSFFKKIFKLRMFSIVKFNEYRVKVEILKCCLNSLKLFEGPIMSLSRAQ